MNKTELVAALAKKTGLTVKDSGAAVNGLIDILTNTLADGDSISLIGFGTFEVRDRAARQGLNPRTKEKIEIPACKVPSFKAGKGLKDAVNK